MNVHEYKIWQSFRKLILRVAACVIVILPPAVLANPAVLYTDINSGPNTGGENNNGTYLSLFGKGFGTDLSQVKVYVGNGEVTRYMYLGPSHGRPDVQQLSVQLGPNTSTGPIKVVVNGVSSNTDKTFTVRPGNFYFISLTGSDSTGIVNDVTHPYRTPNYVARTLTPSIGPGDSIIVRGGTYTLNDGTNNLVSNQWLRPNISGTAQANIAFLGYPGETVNLIQTYPAMLSGQNVVSVAYWVIGNFLVTFNDCAGNDEFINFGLTASSAVVADTNYTLAGTVSNFRIVNLEANGNDTYGLCNTTGTGDSPIEVQHTQNIQLLGIRIHNTSPALAATEGSHELYLSATQRGTEIGWCQLDHLPATRAVIQVHMDSYGSAGTKQLTDITIHDNLIHDVAGQAIMLDGGTGDITLYNNVIYKSTDARYNDVIALRGSGGVLNANLYNNTIYDDAGYGFTGFLLGFGGSDGTLPQHVTLYNNAFYLTDPNDAWYGSDWANASQLQAWIQGGGVTSDHNLWYGSTSPTPPFAGSSELSVNPLFVDTTVGNFRLTSPTSPAIDKGTSLTNVVVTTDFDGNPRPQGNGTDIGAFEASGITLPAPQNVTLLKK